MPVQVKKPHKYSASISIFKQDNKFNHIRSNSLDATNEIINSDPKQEIAEPDSAYSEYEISNQVLNVGRYIFFLNK